MQVASRQDLLDRWPGFGSTMLASGFQSVHATPLVWHGTVLGAMGAFRREDVPFTADEHLVARAFADIATILVVQLDDIGPDALVERIRDALDARVVIEQAKGVLADVHDVPMADAYDRLVQDAAEHQTPLTAWATSVVESTYKH